ncbi:C-terminal binding protein [Paucibacter sp. R3-3]|uniref:C-terminal binding protein n=1 Tax=Roseateles agri TaxID=3098619 RepID=A0ABU5DN63_9BURK|nr:C-terminal binding protein [Paucibacter sp. R3-3]MDY0746714.1 C-terminal binding protein [Paucibacter sp. R3-3]
MNAPARLVVALDGGYASYDQEEALFGAAHARFELRPCAGSEAAALEAVRGADIVMVRESPVSRAVIDAMDRCKGVVRYGIGVDNIDLQAARERQIRVANVPDYGIEEVSTHAVALLLAVARQVRQRDQHVRAGQWNAPREQPMYRLRGRTLGLIGYGRIARQVQEKLAGFGFERVLVHDPFAVLPADVTAASVEEICAQSDAISLHAPLTAQTRHLIDAPRLALVRPTAILVNTARGGLVDLDALHEALVAKRLLGAGLDVFEPEPPAHTHPVFALPNVVVSDHIGWYSEEAMRELQRKAAEEVVRMLAGETPKHWLNA